jgi:DNA-binding transcriptional LysR family regulator
MMDGYLVRYFLAVAELGNFSRAAELVNVTQPTLSVGIAKLENQLGAKLFERNKRRVTLTAAGSRFLVHATQIAHEYDLALRAVSGTVKPRHLRLGILSTIPTRLVEEIVVRHRELQSGERLDIIDGSERDLRNRLEDGRLDIALTIVRPNSDRFLPERLYLEDYALVVARTHRFAGAEMVQAEALAEDAMIIRRHCEVLAETSRYFTQRGVRPSFGLKTSNDDRALALVRAGLGITVMPQSFADPGVRHVRLAEFDLRREIGLLYAHPAPDRSASESAFIDVVRMACADRFG